MKGVVKDLKKLINHPRLKTETQNHLKFFFRANEEIQLMQFRDQEEIK
jgi:hypothetical protein